MIYKYELQAYFRVPCNIKAYHHCLDMCQTYFYELRENKNYDEFFKSLISTFKYHAVPFGKYIINYNMGDMCEPKIIETCAVKYFRDFEIDTEWKDYLVIELADYYDEWYSEHGLQTIVAPNNRPVGNAMDILKGTQKSWIFKNKFNQITLLEHWYDEQTGERQYDASAFLNALCK